MLCRAGIVLAFAVLLLPSPALAHGPLTRGQVLNPPASVEGTTGICSCLARWYTIGARSGTVTLSPTLERCGNHIAKYCYIDVYLVRVSGLKPVKHVHITCSSTAATCNHTARSSYHVRHAGVYYLMVHGEGATTIFFSLAVRGHLYHLHCGQYC